jgi:hypothetical protein
MPANPERRRSTEASNAQSVKEANQIVAVEAWQVAKEGQSLKGEEQKLAKRAIVFLRGYEVKQ